MACRYRFALSCLMAAATAAACAPPSERPILRAGFDITLERDSDVIEARVPRNATLAGLLEAHQVSEELANLIVEATRRAFDPRRLRAEQPYRLERGFDGLVRSFEYKIDADRFLRIVGAGSEAAPPTFDARVENYEKQQSVVTVRGQIDRAHPSLVAALEERGESVLLALGLADVYGGDIDFNNDLQPGDSFDLVFEKTFSEGEFAGYGAILAAEFRNDGRVLRAFRFQSPGAEPGYYDEQGRSLKRFFLRSPLKFEPRISSGFTYRRLHPVLGEWRSHPAIDYVAPKGSPVVAIASGVVSRAGWAGGSGNMVTIRHSNGYESNYLHLSAVGVRTGARVAQGQEIGKVGATGLATGPHLDYRLKKNGAWVNPLVEQKKLPPGEPIAPQQMSAFASARADASAHLLELGATTAITVTGTNEKPTGAAATQGSVSSVGADAQQ
jgi:murein DD-endopeptidase MepM/ murein hydrolase activator NlpD